MADLHFRETGIVAINALSRTGLTVSSLDHDATMQEVLDALNDIQTNLLASKNLSYRRKDLHEEPQGQTVIRIWNYYDTVADLSYEIHLTWSVHRASAVTVAKAQGALYAPKTALPNAGVGSNIKCHTKLNYSRNAEFSRCTPIYLGRAYVAGLFDFLDAAAADVLALGLDDVDDQISVIKDIALYTGRGL